MIYAVGVCEASARMHVQVYLCMHVSAGIQFEVVRRMRT